MFEYMQNIRSKEYHKELIRQGTEERLASACAKKTAQESRKDPWGWAILSYIFRRANKARYLEAKLN